jgi:hypothetical protein
VGICSSLLRYGVAAVAPRRGHEAAGAQVVAGDRLGLRLTVHTPVERVDHTVLAGAGVEHLPVARRRLLADIEIGDGGDTEGGDVAVGGDVATESFGWGSRATLRPKCGLLLV